MQNSDQLTVNLKLQSNIELTPRVLQVSGMFDVPPNQKLSQEWNGVLPLNEREWNIGIIVGASGSGKSSILKELFRSISIPSLAI